LEAGVLKMKLGELIRLLEALPSDMEIEGIDTPHSYRGYYECLAFEKGGKATVQEVLTAVKSALYATYFGWKGGEYTMHPDTEVFIANVGSTGQRLEGFGWKLGSDW